jgi:hypothetical protein
MQSKIITPATIGILATLLFTLGARADEIKELNAYYFGNSYTGNTMPGLHPLLGSSAGKQWKVHACINPGVPIWTHTKKLMDKGKDYEAFVQAAPQTDAIVMLIFAGPGLERKVTEVYQGAVKFDQPTDIGDINACTYIICEYLKHNSKGRAYIYTAWPGIPEARDFRKRVQDESRKAMLNEGLSREEILAKVKERKLTHEEMEPLRKKFDYSAGWLAKYDPAECNPGGSPNTHCREHMYRAMEGVKKNFPEMWAEGRLGMIPVGDVFLELDKKMRAGQVPGIVNVGEFSADGGHLRSGLPRYTLAATYYAALFREHPGKVDWKIFQDRANYESKKFGFYVHQPDLAVHLDITPERAKVVNDTIWEVVKGHPYTQIPGREGDSR